MSATPLPNPRYECKFLATGLSLGEAIAVVRRHPALFREVFAPRAVNNIYLDTRGLSDYFDHVKGVAGRHKTRIRWYGDLRGDIAAPTLERKIKRGGVGGKAGHRLPGFALDGQVAPHVLDASLAAAELPGVLRLAMGHLCPSLVNRYQRQYWLSACGRFRLTVDWNLQFFALHSAGLARPLVPANQAVIVELKFDPAHALAAATVTNALPLRIARCSKYVQGIEHLVSCAGR